MDDKKDVKTGENRPDSVPYIVFEGELARLESIHKEDKERSDKKFNKVFWALVGAVILLVATNAFWLIRETQFEDVVLTQEGNTDGGGNINLNGAGVGDVNFYGQSETDNQSTP